MYTGHPLEVMCLDSLFLNVWRVEADRIVKGILFQMTAQEFWKLLLYSSFYV